MDPHPISGPTPNARLLKTFNPLMLRNVKMLAKNMKNVLLLTIKEVKAAVRCGGVRFLYLILLGKRDLVGKDIICQVLS